MISTLIPQLVEWFPNTILRAIIVFAVAFVVLKVVSVVVIKLLHKFAGATETTFDDILISKLAGPIGIIATLGSVSFGLMEIDTVSILTQINNTIIALIISYTLFVCIQLTLLRVFKKITENKLAEIDKTLTNLVTNILIIIFFIMSTLYILTIWGVEIGPLLAGLGVAGLAVALALQPTLANIFSGISLVIDKAFKIGDVIRTSDGKMGVVYEIGLRTTKIKTFDNELFIIPNTNLADSTIENMFLPDRSVRVNVEFGVEYGVDPEYIKKISIEEIKKIDFIDHEKDINILFLAMADSALNFKIMYWVDDIDKKWPAHQEGITRIYRRLYKEGISIPFPQQTVWMNQEKQKSKSPSDKKFSSTNKKYFAKFGREYKEEEPQKETKVKQKSTFKLFKKKK